MVMTNGSRNLGLSLKAATAAVLLAVGASSSAQATIAVERGNDPADLTNNVLFNSGESSQPSGFILGDLNGGPADVIKFTSSTDTLVTQASGQSKLSSQDFVDNAGQLSDQNGINQLTVTALSPFVGFEAFQLAFNGEAGTAITFTGVDQFNNPQVFPFILEGSVGQDRFTFTTDAAQYITSLSFTSNAGVDVSLEDVRQFRVGLASAVPGPIAGASLPALLALGAFGWVRRRRTVAPVTA